MKTEQHKLSLTSYRSNDRGVNETDDCWRGICSCAKWRVINRPKRDILEAHAQHVQEKLGRKESES